MSALRRRPGRAALALVGGGAAALLAAAPAAAVPVAGVSDVRQLEGTSGWRPATFQVCLSETPAGGESVSVATEAGGARSGADFAPTTAELRWGAGAAQCQQLGVGVRADGRAEGTERFRVRLSAPQGVTIGDATGVATIRDDDTLPKRASAVVTERQIFGPNSSLRGFDSENLTGVTCPADHPWLLNLNYSRWEFTSISGIDLLQTTPRLRNGATPVYATIDTAAALYEQPPGRREAYARGFAPRGLAATATNYDFVTNSYRVVLYCVDDFQFGYTRGGKIL